MTTAPLFLVDALPSGDIAVLDGPEGRHAVTVKWLRPGEGLVLGDGRGGLARAVVEGVAKDALRLRVTDRSTLPPPSPRVVLAQALVKGDRGELAVELLTEIGVSEIVPWAASRSVAVWKGDRAVKSLARWRSTAREAAKQARRSWFPVVSEPAATSDVAALLAGADLGVVLHEEAAVPLATLDVPASGRIVVVVGPEGGLTDEEVAAFAAAGAQPVVLGAEVLRTSTAGIASVAALLSRTPRW
jgi:16S rRNA (uracil1498-N3)-methyltransferase